VKGARSLYLRHPRVRHQSYMTRQA